MNDANKETNTAYEEPKKKVYVKLIIFLALITALFIVLGAKFVTFYYKTHGIGGHYFYKGCDAEVVHQLPEGLTDEDISNAVIMRTIEAKQMTMRMQAKTTFLWNPIILWACRVSTMRPARSIY
mgnify:CR=1 FL=1